MLGTRSVCSRIGLAWLTAALSSMPLPARPEPAHALPDSDAYLALLIGRAQDQRLFDEPTWHALLHYRSDGSGGKVESQAAGDEFFLAANGRVDARAELEAMLRGFFIEVGAGAGDEHPQCRFPARFRWLGQRLEIDRSELPTPECGSLLRWYEGLRPGGLTLVFPEAYMNNPASMFGHTLLRVDRAGEESDHDLLAYAINFAAETGADGGAAFALKGIFGFYDGFFSILPYYDKLKQYGDWENRDIWEYPLSLSREQTDLVVMHVWELRRVPFRYYFFDDNCSYQILALIEVARPELRLTEAFPAWVIPVDTAREVVETSGLAQDASYRASPATRLRHDARALSSQAQSEALAIARGLTDPAGAASDGLGLEQRGAVLGLSYDYLRYQFLAGDVTREESAKRAQGILEARSALGAPKPESPEPPAPAVRPDQGHPPAMLGLGAGWEDGRPYIAARLRPAFHSLVDPQQGYTRGAQIRILDTTIQLFPEDGDVHVEEAVLVDVTSLSPRDRFLRPVSWTVGTGLERRPFRDGRGDLDGEAVWRSAGGAGLAYAIANGTLGYGLAGALVDVAPVLDHDVALGPSAQLGLLTGPASDRWGAHLSARLAGFVVGDDTTSTRVGLEGRLTVSPRTALVGEVAYEHSYGEDWAEARLMCQVYFQRRVLKRR